MAASQLDIDSRQKNTTLQGYDQIVALSQNNVNASFAFLSENSDILKAINIDVENEGTMTAVLDPPTVEFVVDSEAHKAVFFLNLRSGSFEFWTGHGPSSVKNTANFKNWVFALNVNLNLSLLEQNQVPQSVINTVRVPGSYSVHQLLLDFQTADIASFDVSRSKFPGIQSLDKVAVDVYFQMYIGKYIALLKQGGHNILGHAISVPDSTVANPEAPTFPPTKLQLQTYAYRSGGTGAVQPGNGYNSLLFLEMTGPGDRPLPTAMLNWSGNFIIPNLAGTMAISKRNFWDGYLLPKLEAINKSTLLIITDVNRTAFNADYAWKTIAGKTPITWTNTSNGATFNFKSSKSDDIDAEIAHYRAEANSSVSNKVEWTAGSSVINCSGETTGYAKALTMLLGVEENCWCNVSVKWSFTITLKSVQNGGLEVDVSAPNVTPSSSVDGDLLGGLENKTFGGLTGMDTDMVASIKDGMQTDQWESDLEKALNGVNHFVFPAGGVFFMKNPLFNAEGDLLTELTYKQL